MPVPHACGPTRRGGGSPLPLGSTGGAVTQDVGMPSRMRAANEAVFRAGGPGTRHERTRVLVAGHEIAGRFTLVGVIDADAFGAETSRQFRARPEPSLGSRCLGEPGSCRVRSVQGGGVLITPGREGRRQLAWDVEAGRVHVGRRCCIPERPALVIRHEPKGAHAPVSPSARCALIGRIDCATSGMSERSCASSIAASIAPCRHARCADAQARGTIVTSGTDSPTRSSKSLSKMNDREPGRPIRTRTRP